MRFIEVRLVDRRNLEIVEDAITEQDLERVTPARTREVAR
jgi:hypothetical protein